MKKLFLVPAALLLLTGAASARDIPPGPPPEPPAADPMVKCRQCHGPELAGKAKSPAIAGMDKAKIVISLTSKIPKPMAAVAKSLTPEQIEAVATTISKMPKPPAPTTPVPPPG